jgi:hypothetical protein
MSHPRRRIIPIVSRHLDQAIFLGAWPIGFAALAWTVFLRRRPWGVALAGAAVEAGLVVGYPWPFRGEVLGRAYAVIQGAALVAAAAVVVMWVRQKAPPRPEHAAVIAVGLLDVAYFAGPYAVGAPWAAWASADTTALMTWGGLLALHWLVLRHVVLAVRTDLH